MKDVSTTTLQEHQEVLFELLQVFDSICRKHNIKYMLFAGTALGAIRHQGFIPWDDDLDVVMLRSEYNRFMKVAREDMDLQNYFLQTEFTEHWPMFFSKLRKNNTTCLERFIPKDPMIHQGVYIDIFPCDNLSDHKLLRKLQFWASKIVISKSLNKRGYITDSILKKCFIFFCRFLPLIPLKKFVELGKESDSLCVHTFFGGAAKYEKNVYPREWFTKQTETVFEKGNFLVSAYYDELLTKLYGDYMTPLPESQRGCKVHAEIVDLNRPYTEYREYQKTMTFTEYTRSIR